jgi:hypothetical protein
MTPKGLLYELHNRGFRVAVRHGKRFTLRGPKSELSDDFAELLRANRPALLEVIARRPICCECGFVIIEREAWWGGDPCHRDCGEIAWQRVWKEPLANNAAT